MITNSTASEKNRVRRSRDLRLLERVCDVVQTVREKPPTDERDHERGENSPIHFAVSRSTQTTQTLLRTRVLSALIGPRPWQARRLSTTRQSPGPITTDSSW